MLLCQAACLSRYCGMWLSDRLASKWLYVTLIQELAWHWDETDFPACLFRSDNQIVFPPPVFLPSFSCFATSLLIYSLSACPQPTVSHSLIPASHLRRKVRQNSRINTLSATQQMHTHIKRQSALLNFQQCPYPKWPPKTTPPVLSFTLCASVTFTHVHAHPCINKSHLFSLHIKIHTYSGTKGNRKAHAYVFSFIPCLGTPKKDALGLHQDYSL